MPGIECVWTGRRKTKPSHKLDDMKVLVLIPARYASTRFPGKPLAKILGKEMILRVCEQVSRTGYELAVATDDERIFNTVTGAGFRAVMTRADHPSGTDRLAEAYGKLGIEADVIVNVQGDEPFIDPKQIQAVVGLFENHPGTQLGTLARPYPQDGTYEGIADPNLVKLVKSETDEALYFSRSVIPYVRGVEPEKWPSAVQYYTHIGIYAYTPQALREVVAIPRSPLEKAESLEQLRWLQNGYRIRVAVSDAPTIGIDTPADLRAAEQFLSSRL